MSETLREAVEALAETWQGNAAANERAGHFPWAMWQNRANELRHILAEHPATPAEVEHHHRRHNRCGLGDPGMCGHPDCPDMRAEPDAGDVGEGLSEAEREAVCVCPWDEIHVHEHRCTLHRRAVERVVADRERKAEQRGAEKALREAADAYLAEYGTWGGASQGAWLRARADRIGAES